MSGVLGGLGSIIGGIVYGAVKLLTPVPLTTVQSSITNDLALATTTVVNAPVWHGIVETKTALYGYSGWSGVGTG